MENENFFRLLFAAGETSLSFLYSNTSDLRKQLLDKFIKEVHTKAEDVTIIKEKKEFFDNAKKKVLEEGGFYESIKKLASNNPCIILWSIVFDWLIKKEREKIIVFTDLSGDDFHSYTDQNEFLEEDIYTNLFVYGKVPKNIISNRENKTFLFNKEENRLRKKMIYWYAILFIIGISINLLLYTNVTPILRDLVNICFFAIVLIIFIIYFKRKKDIFEEITNKEINNTSKEMLLREFFPLGRNYTKEEVSKNPQKYLRVRINPFIDDQRKINQLKTMVEFGFNPEIYQHIDAIDIYEDLGENSIKQIKKTKYGEPLEIYRKGPVVLIIEDALDKCILVKKWVKDIDLNTIDVPLIFQNS